MGLIEAQPVKDLAFEVLSTTSSAGSPSLSSNVLSIDDGYGAWKTAVLIPVLLQVMLCLHVKQIA